MKSQRKLRQAGASIPVASAPGKPLRTIRQVKVLTVRKSLSRAVHNQRFDHPSLANRFWRDHIETAPWFEPEKEQLVMLMLNSLYEPIAYNLVSMGGLTESIAHPRDILRVAVVCNAYAIILIHNHPSGRPFPSTSDAFATKRCAKAATTIGIRLLDHVIIGKAGTYTTSKKIKGQTERVRFASYFSLKEAGLI